MRIELGCALAATPVASRRGGAPGPVPAPTPTPTPPVAWNSAKVMSEGDSIMAAGTAPSRQYTTAFAPASYANYAVGGSGVNSDTPALSMNNRKAAVLSLDPDYIFTMAGANDLADTSRYASAAAWVSAYLAYLDDIKTRTSQRVIVESVLPRGPASGGNYATHNARWPAANALLAAAVGGGIVDAFVDCDKTIMGLEATTTDPTYYDSGNLHPTTGGDTVRYLAFKGEVNALRGIANTPAPMVLNDVSGASASTSTPAAETYTVNGLARNETATYSVSSGHSVRKRTGIGGSWGSWTLNGSGTVQQGDGLQFAATSSATNLGTVTVTGTVTAAGGSASDSFTITTGAANAMKMSATDKAASLTVSADGLTVSQASDPQTPNLVRSTIPFTGKRYAEMTINSRQGVFNPKFGVCNSTASLTAVPGAGNSNGGGLDDFGQIEPSQTYGPGALANGDVVMLAFDTATNLLWMGKNGAWASTTNPATGTNGENIGALANYYLWVGLSRTDNVTVNTGGTAFAYTPPTGFTGMP